MPTILNLASLLIFVVILLAAFLHRRVTLHVRLMKLCFALDCALLLIVELLRGAVEQVLGLEPSSVDSSMLAVHIPFAVMTLVFWIVQIVTGSKILKGRRELLSRHLRNGCVFIVLRLGTLVTAYLL